MASRSAMPTDPDAGIPDLIRRLADDSKRLAQDEMRLAKLEVRENVHDATRGGIWLGIAGGAALIALIALTVCLAALLGRLFGHYWMGTLVVAVVELGVGALLVMRGLKTLKAQSFSFPATRGAATETARWVKTVREPEIVGSSNAPRPAFARGAADRALPAERLGAAERVD